LTVWRYNLAPKVFVFFSLVLLSGSLCAQDTEQSSWYVGGKLGFSKFANACSSDALTCDQDDLGIGFYGGWQMNDWFGLELGYADLGQATASYSIPDDLKLNGSLTILDLSARIRWPFAERWNLYGKAGAAYTNAEADSEPGALSETEVKLLVGGGLSFDFSDHWQSRIEYQFIDEIGNDEMGYFDSHFLSLNLVYYFGK
jgi:OOP family OmpA-OmpF porin